MGSPNLYPHVFFMTSPWRFPADLPMDSVKSQIVSEPSELSEPSTDLGESTAAANVLGCLGHVVMSGFTRPYFIIMVAETTV